MTNLPLKCICMNHKNEMQELLSQQGMNNKG